MYWAFFVVLPDLDYLTRGAGSVIQPALYYPKVLAVR